MVRWCLSGATVVPQRCLTSPHYVLAARGYTVRDPGCGVHSRRAAAVRGANGRLQRPTYSAPSPSAQSMLLSFQEETEAFARLNADFDSRRDLILAKYAARKGAGCGG